MRIKIGAYIQNLLLANGHELVALFDVIDLNDSLSMKRESGVDQLQVLDVNENYGPFVQPL